jgi:hypothetical protein
MTFLEVVFATAMLGIVAGAMFGVYAFALGSEAKQQQRLGAVEVANKLILNYLDSPSGMPDPSKPVEFGLPPGPPLKYRWELREELVRVVEPSEDQRDRSRESPLKNDRFRQVSVHVWLSEQSGGSRYADGNTPSATLSRMLDPIAPRNPDSYMAMIKNQGDLERLIQTFMGMGAVSPATSGAATGFQRATGGGGMSQMDSMGRSRVRSPLGVGMGVSP